MSNSGTSIITPSLNLSADTITKTLGSVLRQSAENWEWIIIHDNVNPISESEKLKILRDDRIRIIERKDLSPNLNGANVCRNIGIQNAKYPFVAFLDDDDELLPFFVENRLSAFTSGTHQDSDFLIFPVYKNAKGILTKIGSFSSDPVVEILEMNHPWTISSVLWKKSVIEKLLFDKNLVRFQDPDIHLRALKAGLNYSFVEGEPDFKYHAVLANSEKNIRQYEGYIQFIEKHHNFISSQPKYLRAAKNAFLGFYRSSIYALPKDLRRTYLDFGFEKNFINKFQYKYLRLLSSLKIKSRYLRKILFLPIGG